MLNNDVDFKDCPIGVKNTSDIQHLSETVDLRMKGLMDRIEEKIDNMNEKMKSEFVKLNSRLDTIDTKVNKLDEKMANVDDLEKFVEKKIEENTKDKAYRLVRWVIVVLLGGTAVTVLGRYVLALLSK